MISADRLNALLYNPTVRQWLADPELTSIQIQGETITRAQLQSASAALAADLLERKETGWLDRRVDATTAKLAETTSKAERVLEKDTWWARTINKVRNSNFATMVAKIIFRDAERVTQAYDVTLHRADGTSSVVPLELEDPAWSKVTQRASFASEGLATVPGIPFWGLIVPVLTAAASAVGGGFAALLGRKALARALGNMSLKHLVLGLVGGTVGALPFVGSLVAGAAALQEAKDLKALQDSAPTVEELRNLAQLKAQAAAEAQA